MTVNRVIFGVPSLNDGSVVNHVAGAVRGLGRREYDARILVTEASPDQAECLFTTDVRVESLPLASRDSVADRWLSLIRYLEEHAPCIYVTNGDSRAALACSRLSNRVKVIGVLHEDSQAEYNHCARLGQFWNAIVVLDPALRQRIIGEFPQHAARLAPFDQASASGGVTEVEDNRAAAYSKVFELVERDSRSGLYRRRRVKMAEPPASLMPDMSESEIVRDVKRVNSVRAWPDTGPRLAPMQTTEGRTPLAEHRIVIAVPTGRVSGVDVFSVHLARELIKLGYKAELVITDPDAPVADRLPLPDGVPAYVLKTRSYPTWRERWAAMREHLLARAPCIYLPNYDSRHSCIVPGLPSSVKVVGIGHSDDPQHYSHIVSMAEYWDAIVGVSDAVTDALTDLIPGAEDRQWTIPYGVQVPEERVRENIDRPLQAIYTGRIVQTQKRVMDLISVVEELEVRSSRVELTVVGGGTELAAFLERAGPLIGRQRLHYVGGVTNEAISGLLSGSDAFLLPSSFEGMPISLLEAMAHGCVPIVTRIRSGVPQIVRDGENGFIVPIGAVGDFAERLTRLENDRELLAGMRKNAYQTVREEFSMSRMVAAYAGMFETVVSRPYARPRGRRIHPAGLHPVEAILPRFPQPLQRTIAGLRGRF